MRRLPREEGFSELVLSRFGEIQYLRFEIGDLPFAICHLPFVIW